MNVVEPAPPGLRRIKIDLPGGRRVKLTRITFDPSGDYETSEVEITLKGTDRTMNTTHIYEPDEQNDHHFQIATWYGPHDKLPTDIPVPDRVQVWGDPYMLSITAPGGDSIMLMKESIDGLKLMLDWYEDWLEENDHAD